jgi:signal transduction histidine kinase
MEQAAKLDGAERRRVEAVVETLATLGCRGESLAEVAHDARNMVTALGLYCDLLEEPGVLAASFHHYGNELRLVATASRRLVEKLVALDCRNDSQNDSRAGGGEDGREALQANLFGDSLLGAGQPAVGRQEQFRRWELLPAEPICNLAAELLASRNLLAALAGPSIAVTVDAKGGAMPIRLTGEDLTRVLVNLVKNAAEAMPQGGRIHLGLSERPAPAGAAPMPVAPMLVLTVEDNGPGIPRKALEKIFESGYTTRPSGGHHRQNWPASHRGLGLSITRSIIEAAGGRIGAANRAPTGACFEIELPVRER